MPTKHSKATRTLLAQFPTFDDWIINNLTPGQVAENMKLMAFHDAFSDGHPLRSQELAVQLWRAYTCAARFELKCRWPDADFTPPIDREERLEFFHTGLCMAIGLYATEQPELLELTVARARREIDDSTGPAQFAASQSDTVKRRNRL